MSLPSVASTYLLSQILDQNADALDILGLLGVLHHLLHLLLHLRELALSSQNPDQKQVLHLDILGIVGLQLSGLLKALVLSLLDVSEEERSLDHVEDVEIFFHFVSNY